MELLAIGLSIGGLVFIFFVWLVNVLLLRYWDNWDKLLTQNPTIDVKIKPSPIVKNLKTIQTSRGQQKQRIA